MTTPAKSCYLICGDDDFQVLLEARRLIDAFVPPAERDFGLETVDARVETVDESSRAIRACCEALTTDGLFGGGNKLVWLREPSFLSIDRISRSATTTSLVADLTNLIKQGLPEGQRLILTTFKINRATALFKAFNAPHCEIKDFGNNLKPRQHEARAKTFIEGWLPQTGLQLDSSVLQALLDRTGYDTRTIVSELEKLRCYCGERTKVTVKDITDIVASGATAEVWDLLDSFALRRSADFIKELRVQLSQAESPIRLATSLDTRVSELLTVRELLDRKWATSEGYGGLRWGTMPPEITAWFDGQEKDMRRWPAFRLGKLVTQAATWRLRELRVARHLIIELREKLVSSSLPQEWLTETYLLRAIGRQPPRQGAATR